MPPAILAADPTLGQFLSDNWGTLATLIGAIGTAFATAFTWFARVVWVRVEEYWGKRDKREALTAEKTDTLIETLTTHAPKQTVLLEKMVDTQQVISSDIKESHKRDSDVIYNLESTKMAGVDLIDGIEAMMIKEDSERERAVKRAMDRARLRLSMGGQRVKSVKPQELDHD